LPAKSSRQERVTSRARSRASFLVAAAFVASVASTAVAQDAPALDSFLIGFEQACAHGETYRRFTDGLLRRDGPDVVLTGRIDLPPELGASIGEPVLQQHDDVAVVSIPLRGTYMGAPLVALHLLRGPHRSTAGDAIQLDLTVERAHLLLDAMIARSRAGLGRGVSLGIEEEDGRVLLACLTR
jgi:hypothetical protein